MSSDESTPGTVEELRKMLEDRGLIIRKKEVLQRIFHECLLQMRVTQSDSAGTTKSAPFESRQLCEYTKRTKIGHGGFGVVFKAQHGIDERLYAIKQVAPVDVTDTKRSPNKVLREVRFLAKLDHPHIVRYYGAWLEMPPAGEKLPRMDSNQPCLYIRMEWCGGSTLHEWLGQNQLPAQRPILQTLDWFSQLVSAVKYIHDKGLIHRDIKPQNIFFGSSSDGAASALKIGDFGLAIGVAPPSSSGIGGDVSKSLSIVGTGSYMSPEQPSGHYKNSTDIFSLGIVFLEMVHSFKTDRERDTAFGALRANQRSAVMNKLDKEMDELISWMTAFEPEKRATSSELDNELKKMRSVWPTVTNHRRSGGGSGGGSVSSTSGVDPVSFFADNWRAVRGGRRQQQQQQQQKELLREQKQFAVLLETADSPTSSQVSKLRLHRIQTDDEEEEDDDEEEKDDDEEEEDDDEEDDDDEEEDEEEKMRRVTTSSDSSLSLTGEIMLHSQPTQTGHQPWRQATNSVSSHKGRVPIYGKLSE